MGLVPLTLFSSIIELVTIGVARHLRRVRRCKMLDYGWGDVQPGVVADPIHSKALFDSSGLADQDGMPSISLEELE